MEVDKIDFSEKEKRLFFFTIKVKIDSNSIGDEDFVELREAGVTDQEIVHALELMYYSDSLDSFRAILGI